MRLKWNYSVLFLEKPPGSGGRLKQLLRVLHSCHRDWKFNVVTVHGRNSECPNKKTKPTNQNSCAEWVLFWDFPGMDWKLCRSMHQFGSLVSVESIFSCLWKLCERKYSTHVDIPDEFTSKKKEKVSFSLMPINKATSWLSLTCFHSSAIVLSCVL